MELHEDVEIHDLDDLEVTPMNPNEFLAANELRQKLREITGHEPEYVNFNNAATKYLLDKVIGNDVVICIWKHG